MNPGFLFAALSILGAGELHAQMPRPIPGATVREGTLSFDGRATTGAFTGTTTTVRGDTPLNLKDYKIEGLSKMMGMLKMYDKIVVHLDLRFTPTGGTLGSGIRRSGS